MMSLDTNLLLPSLVEDHDSHPAALEFVQSLTEREDVLISEFVLLELYGLLRNPCVLSKPLDAPHAVTICEHFRRHPRWRLVGFTAESRMLHDKLLKTLREGSFARRRAYDIRLALTLIQHGVTDFATVNVKDFQGLGFRRVWDPLKTA